LYSSLSAITGAVVEIQPHQYLIGRPGQGRKALTLQYPPFIRAPMAAGAIPPPQFFERRRQLGSWPGNGILGNTFTTTSVDRSIEWPTRLSPRR
jgi:hypothetical protein